MRLTPLESTANALVSGVAWGGLLCDLPGHHWWRAAVAACCLAVCVGVWLWDAHPILKALTSKKRP